MTVNRDGYPRLPFNKFWPDQAQLDALIRRAKNANGDPLEALQSVLRLVYSYQALQGQNATYESRLWGQTDVSERTAEHWNYLRNSDFTQGATGLYKWLATSVTAITGTTGLPYGVRNAIQGTNNNVTADRFIAQSVSANGNTWWCYGGWVKALSGAYAGFAVVENSGSASGRTHASFIPGDGNWRYLPDHQVSTREFRTYKGTTRMVFRCAIKGNAIAQFARVMLEQGRRPHPWRPNILDRGNYITSIKTAGSASFYGNVLLSASGGAVIRQKATKAFVFGTRYGSATPIPVSTSGTVGTATTLARSDHRHRGLKALKYGGLSKSGTVAVSGSGTGAGLAWSGSKLKVGFPKPATSAPVNPSTAGAVGTGTTWMRVDGRVRAVRSMRTAGSASFSASIVISGSAGARIRQIAGPPRKFVFGAPKVAASTVKPLPVSTSGTGGIAVTVSASDHVHRGVKAIKYGTASRDGTVAISGSGVGWGLAWSGQKLKIGFPKPATTAPVNPSTSATVGTGTTWMRADARERAVRSLRTAGSASFAASIVLSSSGTGTIRQIAGPPRKFVFPIPPAASAAPVNPSTSATVGTSGRYMRQDARLRAVRSLRTAGSASFSASIVLSASGSAAIRQVAGPPKKFVFPFPSASGATPVPVSTSGTVGTAGLYARQGHRHRGVKALKYGGVSTAGTIAVSGSGTGWGLAWSGAKLKFGFPKPATAAPVNPSTSATVGTGTTWMRVDARQRAVRSLRTAGSASFSASIILSASGTAAIRQVAGPPKKFVFPFPSASGTTPTPVSTAGTVGTTGLYARQAHQHRGVKALKYGGVSNTGTLAISGSGTGWGLAWSAKKLKVGFPKPATATPTAPSTSGTVGTGTLWSRTDHRHRGVKSCRTPGSASFAGSIVFSASTNAAVRQVAGPPRKFVFGATGGGAGTEKAANAALRWLHFS